MRLGAREIRLYHGRSVEVEETRFVEGAWSGEFAEWGFARATFFTGSGGQITAHGVEFVTSMHTAAPIFLIRLEKEVIVSNSLTFLLTQADDDLDTTYKFYTHDMMSIMDGIRKYVPSFPTAKGNRIEQFYFCNIHIGPQANVTRGEKSAPPAFESYKGYKGFLSQQVRAIPERCGVDSANGKKRRANVGGY